MRSIVRVYLGPHNKQQRGFSSVGRAPGLQPGGHRFDPVKLHIDDSEELSRSLTSWEKVMNTNVFIHE